MVITIKIGGITKRWIASTLFIIIALLVIISISAFVTIRGNYYKSAYLELQSASNDVVLKGINIYNGNTEEFLTNANEFIESLSIKENMEVWVIDGSGIVRITSSGLYLDSNINIPEYNEALNSESGQSDWTGKMPSGQKIMAITTALPGENGERSGAVRFMISLEEIDKQLLFLFILIAFSCIFAILLIVLSGLFFVRSIVKPIKEISATAKQIAEGDLNARIDPYAHDDEIGELCLTINNMAKELSEADRIKHDFISTISHELRTPLTAIMGWGETLIQVGDTDATLTKRGLEVILNEVSRLSGIVEELLDFSGMQSGRMKLRLERIDVLAELDETVFYFRERATTEGIEIIYNAPHLPAQMDADADRIRQVFINVLDNCLKYTEHGGKITIFAEFKNANSICISITDTGCGIPADFLPKVKEKFYKINNSIGGSGIGLAVADEIIKLHGGSLEIDSILGEGTTVTISFNILDNIEIDGNGGNNDK